MKWSNTAWEEAQRIYDQIITMPFISDLMEGTLEQDKFNFYILQDAMYLEDFGRTLSLIAARAHRKDDVLHFIRFAEGAIVVERALHALYLKEQEVKQKEVSPACHHYTGFLISTAATAQVEIAMAAVLPCFWIYKKVGDYMLAHQNKNNNPYQNWINTYAGEDFGVAVDKAIQICDEVAAQCTDEQRTSMTHAFVTACKLEWMFWDSAWRMEQWPIK
ncbi:MAG: thiaminase II [Cytophaga sp.]|nr:thiaminase II [Cytophaga sp.]